MQNSWRELIQLKRRGKGIGLDTTHFEKTGYQYKKKDISLKKKWQKIQRET